MTMMITIQDDDVDKLFSAIASSIQIERASHVEPIVLNKRIAWYADMSPVSNPPVHLGPYESRLEALEAEHQWLMDNIINRNSQEDPAAD